VTTLDKLAVMFGLPPAHLRPDPIPESRRYDAACLAILEDRDAWLDLGAALVPIVLTKKRDARGLPVYRVRAGRR
jgi:hypothetical protein